MKWLNAESSAMLIYFVLVIGVGIYFYFKGKKEGNGEKEYFLGGRDMNAWVSALSAGASDMSAWVLMGLPGAIYAAGFSKIWISVGLLIGTICAWITVAPKLRRYSIYAKDSITIPQFLANRFLSDNKTIQIVSAIVFMVTYCVYAAASIYACGQLFNTVIGMKPSTAMIIATVVIVGYTFMGGYKAVCWTDFFQGLIMLGALMLAPILAYIMMKSPEFSRPVVKLSEGYFSLTTASGWEGAKEVLYGLGWGLGYFGMPHILIRYLSISSEKEVRKSQIIGCSWILLILAMASVVGILGREYLGDKLVVKGKELVFIEMVRSSFVWLGSQIGSVGITSFVAGILLSAILAASMSTADSQLLASSSAFASDIYKPLFRKNANDKEMLWAGRIIVTVIAIIAFLIASSPKCQGIMALVECAWAAFGAAFGPVIILALYWKRLTYKGAVAGIIVGFLVDALWYAFLAKTGIYEIIPGFIAGMIAAAIVSLLDKAPSAEVVALFEKTRTALAEEEAK
ncbi:MAG: sodium/proline symporter [Lentisphaeria bacterium]|nr:sodium/proline symporter [Lentisphaeria bacterium]